MSTLTIFGALFPKSCEINATPPRNLQFAATLFGLERSETIVRPVQARNTTFATLVANWPEAHADYRKDSND